MIRYIFFAAILFLYACNNSSEQAAATQDTIAEERPDFFPVTSYIKGQIHDINQKGLTPIKYTTINDKTDSVMVKFENINDLCKEFLQPEIDSSNLIDLFTETKFLDQTVNAFTFTYDPKKKLPDTVMLKHWDVYVDPETGKVKRVYIIKSAGQNKTLQLTWQSNEWFKTTSIITDVNGESRIEKEEKISWDY
ncbi:hypothetical protein [Ferruginibacter sp.]|nr:hypothetical protein [Ferruginibacter sp.]